MQKRVLEIALSEKPWAIDEQWDLIRRGWYFGSEEFKDQMLEQMDLSSGERRSFSGEEVGAHDEIEAEHLLKAGLKALARSSHRSGENGVPQGQV